MRRRTFATLTVAAVLAITSTAPASAEAPKLQSYESGGYGTALVLDLLGQQLAVSHTEAAVSATPEAAADGAALLLAGTPVPSGAPAKAPGGPEGGEACTADVDLGELSGGALSALGVNLACVTTKATISEASPASESTTGELIITLTSPGGTALAPLLAPLFDTIPQVTDPIFTALDPLLGPIEEVTQVDLDTILSDLLTDLQDESFVLAQIVVAPSATRAGATVADGVFARAGSNGVTINLLPGIGATLADLGLNVPPLEAPLMSVKLGQAFAEVVRDPVTGAAKPDALAAQLLGIEAVDDLGILQELTGQVASAINGLAVAELSCDGGALADVICVDLGAVNELDAAELEARGLNFGEGTVGREATAASIRVLPIAAEALGGPVLGLSLASATAAANGAAPALPGAPAAPSLPRTGGEGALPLTLALFAAATAGVHLIRRTRTA